MKVLIYIYHDHKINRLNIMFKSNSKHWLYFNKDLNSIIFSHGLKLYAKNFDCAQPTIKRIISTAKNMKDGYVKRETI